MGNVSDAISPTDFILGTKVQPNKAHFNYPSAEMVKVKVNFPPKCLKIQRTGPISEAISPTDFVLGTKVQPNNVHSTT